MSAHGAHRSAAVRLTALPVDAVEERGRGVDDAAPDGPRSACRGAHSRDATTQPRASRRDAPRDITAGRAGESAHTAKKSRSHCLSIAPIGTPTGSSVAQRAPRRADWGSPRSVSSTARPRSSTASTGSAVNRTAADRCAPCADTHRVLHAPRHGDAGHSRHCECDLTRALRGARGRDPRYTFPKKWAPNRVLALGWGPKFLFFFVFF